MTWYSLSYKYKKSITIDHTKVSGGSNLSNFPVLISNTDTDLKTSGNGGKVQNSSGFDIIFVDSTETTKLDHEIEKYVATTGEIEMWVRIPTLSASSDTVIYMYFDNSTISTSQENKTGVWDSNYVGVWHLKETSGNQNDSTSNANNSSSLSLTTQGSASGKIDGADTLNGSSDFIQVTGLLGKPASCTLSGWANETSAAGNGELISLGDMVAIRVSSSNTLAFYYDGSTWNNTTTGTNYSGAWHYFVYVVDSVGHTQTIYVDGVQKGQTTVANAISYTLSNANTQIGRHGSGTGGNFNGSIDEIRASSTARSAGWSTTEYNSQNSPSTFYTVGSLTQAPAASTFIITSDTMRAGWIGGIS